MPSTAILWASGTPTTSGTTWTNVANATGANNDTFATRTSATNLAAGYINLSGYGAQADIGAAPASVDSLDVTVYAYVGNVNRWAQVTVVLYDGATSISAAQTMTLSATSTFSQTFNFTGITWANLANLVVRVNSVKSGTQSSTFNIDAASVTVNYTLAGTSFTSNPADPVGIADSLSASLTSPTALTESGSIADVSDAAYVATAMADTELYVVPTAQNLADMQSAWQQIMVGNLNAAAGIVDQYAYDVVNFTDTPTGRTLYLLRERVPVGGTYARGWGLYVWSPNSPNSVVYHVPHVKHDLYTQFEGVQGLTKENARGLFQAGSHRNANAQLVGNDRVADVANVTDPPSSVFQYIHAATVTGTNWQVIQYHGFGDAAVQPFGGALYRGHEVANSGDVLVNSLDVAKPWRLQAGDWMFVAVSVRDSTNVITPPSGWTLEESTSDGTLLKTSLYSRIATGSEPSSYTWSWSVATRAMVGLVAYQGTQGIDVSAIGIETGTSVTAHDPPSVTPGFNDSIGFVVFTGASSSTYATPSTPAHVQRIDEPTTGASSVNMGWFDTDGYTSASGVAYQPSTTSSLGYSTGVFITVRLRPTNTPTQTDIVLSDGLTSGVVDPRIYDLRDDLMAAGYNTYVNEGQVDWSAVGNQQGNHTRAQGSLFIHMEQRTGIRDTAGSRDTLTTTVANAQKVPGTATSLTDSVGITDALTAVQSLPRTQADPVGITDALTAALAAARTQSDPVGITDSLSAVLSVTTAKTLADPVGITDSLTQTASLARTQADSVGIADALTASMSGAAAANPADPVGITDALGTTASAGRSQSDSVGITDALGVGLGKAQNDPVGITDSTSTQVSASRSQADAVGITDSLSAALSGALANSLADTVPVSDALSATKAAARQQADPVGITDTLTAAVGTPRSLADPVAITDALSAVLSVSTGATLADPVGITDSLSASLDRQRSQNDPVGIGDALSSQFEAPRTAADNVGITDLLTALLGKTVNPADNVGITDALTVVQSKAISISDSVALADSLSSAAAGMLSANPNDTLAITDALTRALARERALTDVLGITDTLSATLARALADAVEDDVAITDALTAQKIASRPQADGVAITDELVAVLDVIAGRTISDSIGISDALLSILLGPDIGVPARHPGIVVIAQKGGVRVVRTYAGTVTVLNGPHHVTME